MRGAAILRPAHLQQTRCASAAFSTGAGRGRGGWNGERKQPVGTPSEDQNRSTEDPWKSPGFPGRGHGRGLPSTFESNRNPDNGFSPFSAWKVEGSPAGRGRGAAEKPPQDPLQKPIDSSKTSRPKVPVFLKLSDKQQKTLDSQKPERSATKAEESTTDPAAYGRGRRLRIDGLSGGILPPSGASSASENRHLRPSARPGSGRRAATPAAESSVPKLSGEEAVKQAMGILSKRFEDSGEMAAVSSRSRGRGRGKGIGRGRGRGRGGDKDVESSPAEGMDENDPFNVDEAKLERLVKEVGVEKADALSQMIDSVTDSVLPHPRDDEIDDRLDESFRLDYQPEYNMEDFTRNPIIDDDKPPMTLAAYLEALKPYIVAMEGIETEEEWAGEFRAALDRAPYLEALVRGYAGPRRLTVTEEHKQLDKLATNVPSNAHESVKKFVENSLLTLKSNPGWTHGEKCLFMKKLAGETGIPLPEKAYMKCQIYLQGREDHGGSSCS